MLNVEHRQVRSSTYCANFFDRHALGYVQPDRAKCGAIFLSPPLGKGLNIIEQIKGLSLVDTSFAPSDSPRPKQKNWLCHPLPYTGHGGHYDTKHSLFV